jgi:hypothetical protein
VEFAIKCRRADDSCEIQLLQEPVMVNYGWRGSRPLRSGQHRAYRPTLLPDRFARLPLAPGRISSISARCRQSQVQASCGLVRLLKQRPSSIATSLLTIRFVSRSSRSDATIFSLSTLATASSCTGRASKSTNVKYTPSRLNVPMPERVGTTYCWTQQ